MVLEDLRPTSTALAVGEVNREKLLGALRSDLPLRGAQAA